MSTLMVVWILLCALCFGAGLVWSWRRARRRLRVRMEEAVDEEIRQQIKQEVLRHLQDGPITDNSQAER
ncbi:MAG: hypothetical protein JKY21_07915 [Alcanivorax sp.]|nr:hypothetical protein [Alcanivorax sp.]